MKSLRCFFKITTSLLISLILFSKPLVLCLIVDVKIIRTRKILKETIKDLLSISFLQINIMLKFFNEFFWINKIIEVIGDDRRRRLPWQLPYFAIATAASARRDMPAPPRTLCNTLSPCAHYCSYSASLEPSFFLRLDRFS